MSNWLVVVLVAMSGGVAVALQAQFVGLLQRQMGTLESVFITYGSGGLLIGLAMMALRGGNLSAWPTVPWYAFGSGAMGLIIVGCISYSVPRLGIVATFTTFIAVQMIVGGLIDHFGLFGSHVYLLTWPRLFGILVLIVGVWLVIR